jgi:hypothetical protein
MPRLLPSPRLSARAWLRTAGGTGRLCYSGLAIAPLVSLPLPRKLPLALPDLPIGIPRRGLELALQLLALPPAIVAHVSMDMRVVGVRVRPC